MEKITPICFQTLFCFYTTKHMLTLFLDNTDYVSSLGMKMSPSVMSGNISSLGANIINIALNHGQYLYIMNLCPLIPISIPINDTETNVAILGPVIIAFYTHNNLRVPKCAQAAVWSIMTLNT